MKISNSEAKSFTSCKRQYYYRNKRRLQAKAKALPLHRGTWIHLLLHEYFLDNDWEAKHKELADEFDGYFDEEKIMLGDLPTECFRLMEMYEYWYAETDEDVEVIASELELEVELPHGHIYQATLDKVIRDEYGLWIMDHKTHAKYPSANYRFTDIQTARYSYAALKHFNELPVGIIWDYIITKPPTKPKLLKDGSLSKRKINTELLTFVRSLQEYELNPRDYADTIKRLKNYNDFLRRDRVPVTKQIVNQLVKELVYTADEIEGGFKPVRTIGRHCDWCQYQPLCMTELYGGDAKMVTAAQYEPREERYGNNKEEE